MPGYAVQMGSTVICAHAGQATPTTPTPRVLVGNQPVITMTSPWVIAGCALTGTAPPCATAQFVVGATRVMAGGAPVVIQSGTSLCVPTGTPLQVLVTQLRVTAT